MLIVISSNVLFIVLNHIWLMMILCVWPVLIVKYNLNDWKQELLENLVSWGPPCPTAEQITRQYNMNVINMCNFYDK